MASTIITKNGSGAPLASDLVQGELAVDLTNKRLYTEDSGGTVIEVGTNPTSITAGTIDATTITADGLKVETSTTSVITISEDTGSGTAELRFVATDSFPKTKIVTDVSAGSLTLETLASDRLSIANNGDISFYESTGTTAKFFWDASAEALGIGTTNPAAFGTLAVSGTGSVINANASSGAAKFSFFENGTGRFEIETLNGSNGAKFSTSGTERMRIDSSGNVGIGTSSPSYKTEIVGGTLGVGNAAGTSQLGIEIKGTALTALPAAQVRGYVATGDSALGVAGDLLIAPRTDVGTSVRFITGTTPTERLRIDSSGNVGIGTSSPSSLLHLEKSTADVDIRLVRTGYGYTELIGGTGADGNDFKINMNGTDRFYIDNTGYVGIGGSPAAKFDVIDTQVAGQTTVFFRNQSGTDSSASIALRFLQGDGDDDAGRIVSGREGNYTGATASTQDSYLAFHTAINGSDFERMRIDSSGNLLVGKTSSAFGTQGVELQDDRIWSTTSQAATSYFNRLIDDGDIVKFYKDGTTVGSIGSISGPWLYIATPTGTGGGLYIADSEIGPSTSTGGIKDNVMTCGSAVRRWSVVYAGTGSINTSDEREKTTLEDLTVAELAVATELKGAIKKFKFKDAVEIKGEDARIHFGVGAQTVKAIFDSHGLVAEDYAILCYDEWDAEFDADGNEIRSAGNRYGVRYEELLAFIIAAL